ncbi:MAG TPA: UDP-N-acetylmuramoyl-L-alanine--D-glutamate ligase [Xanthobacteraceae bacterium]
MIPVTTFAGKTVAVFGLGGSGLASCRALVAGGAKVLACDDDPKKMLEAQREGFAIADLRDADWTRIAAFVLAPGVPLTHPAPHWSAALARAAGVEVIGDIELFCRERRRHAPHAPFVAVTGTNGKSTTTALVAHLLSRAGHDVQLGGNIGTAILSLAPPSLLPDPPPLAGKGRKGTNPPPQAGEGRNGRVHVIEVSSYQIDLAPSLDPSVGVLINVSEDHLDRHGTLEQYASVKERLVAGVEEGGTAIVGVDDPWCEAAADRIERAGKTVLRVSVRRPLPHGVYANAREIMRASGGAGRAVANLDGISSLRGIHNAQNAACAVGAAQAFGIPDAVIQAALRSFPGLPHRMEEVGRAGKVLFVNDSKATNAQSAAQALACFADIFWIAGGKPKTGGISSLAEFLPHIRKAYLIGEAAGDFAAELNGRVPHIITGTLQRALALAAADARAAQAPEPVVLLSPACASFDQFRNFEARGDAFRKLVAELIHSPDWSLPAGQA